MKPLKKLLLTILATILVLFIVIIIYKTISSVNNKSLFESKVSETKIEKIYEFSKGGGWCELTSSSEHFICLAEDGLILDGQKINDVAPLNLSEFIFSPDYNHYAYILESSQKGASIFLDNELQFSGLTPNGIFLDGYTPLFFSPNSKHFAYVKSPQKGSWVVVLDKKESQPYTWVSQPVFSPDNKLFYIAYQNNKRFLVIDNETANVIGGSEKSNINDDIIFNKDGSKMAYVKIENEKKVLYINSNGQKEGFDSLWNFKFSPNGQRFGYEAKNGKDRYLIIDGQKSGPYKGIGGFNFSPDSKKFAYMASTENKLSVFLDGEKTAERQSDKTCDPNVFRQDLDYSCDEPGDVFFSPNGNQLGYSFRSKSKTLTVINDKEFEGIMGYGVYAPVPVFSPDSKKFAIEQSTTEFKQFIILDNNKGPEFKIISIPDFTPDSKHLIYIGIDTYSDGSGRSCLVVDNNYNLSDCFDHISHNIKIGEDSKSVTFLFLQGKELLKAEKPLK